VEGIACLGEAAGNAGGSIANGRASLVRKPAEAAGLRPR